MSRILPLTTTLKHIHRTTPRPLSAINISSISLHTTPPQTPPASTQTSPLKTNLPDKNTYDPIYSLLNRQSLHPERSETAQSGTDDQVARHLSSYDPSITTPESEFRMLDEECRVGGEVDPLLVSPANREISRLLSPMVGGAVQGDVKMGPSARGWTRKAGVVRVGMVRKGKKGMGVDPYERLLRGLREVLRKRGVEVAGEGERKDGK